MLEIDLTSKFQPVSEIVTNADDQPMKVDLVIGRSDPSVIMEFSITEEVKPPEIPEPLEPLFILHRFLQLLFRHLDRRLMTFLPPGRLPHH